MSSDSESVSSITSSGAESQASATRGTTQEFCIQLITYMNTKLDISCDIDSLEQQEDDNSGTEIYTVREYTIIRFPANLDNSYHRCFIWDSNSYFLVDLATDRAFMHLFSTKSVGKLVNAVLQSGEPSNSVCQSGEPSNSQPTKLKLLFRGVPEKSSDDVPRGRYDIQAEPYYYKMDYTLDFDNEEIQMRYIPDSTNTYSYPNDRRPDISI
jgi:hypothetical protein